MYVWRMTTCDHLDTIAGQDITNLYNFYIILYKSCLLYYHRKYYGIQYSKQFSLCYPKRTLRINPSNAELNTICHLLALLGGATIVVVSRLRIKNYT